MKDSTTISELRFQKYDSGVVHIHDDNQRIKFEKNADDFKKEAEGYLQQFKKSDGVGKISGKNKINLFLIKEGSKLNCAVVKEKSMQKEVEKFVEGL